MARNRKLRIMNYKLPIDKKLVWLTAYDYLTAQILEAANIDAILVGDSLGMVFEGKENTHSVTIEQMCYHTQAVKRGAPNTQIISDMPINTYQTPKTAFENANKLITVGADAVKMEGGEEILPQIKNLINHQIKVVGHIGLTPQTATEYKIVGETPKEAKKMFSDAKALDDTGIQTLILECIPAKIAREITKQIKTPTIGIGAGKYCNGQILVFQDLIGLTDEKFQPKFLKRYLDAQTIIKQAVDDFKNEIENNIFPDEEHSY